MFRKNKHNRNPSSNSVSGNGISGQPQGMGMQPIRTVQNEPIVQEHLRYDTVTEVQPVVHRQYEQVHVHHIEKHIMHGATPNMGGVVERPPLMQEHVNHRFITEVHNVHHEPSYQTEMGNQAFHGPIQSFQPQAYAPQQQAFAPVQQQAFIPQQTGSYAPQAVPASAPAAGFGGVDGRAVKGKHHIFHRPAPQTQPQGPFVSRV